MERETFDRLRSLIYDASGISLGPDKLQLLQNRINKRLRALKLRSPDEYLRIIEVDVEGHELVELLNVISTNVTYFWREEKHFLFLRDMLRSWFREGKRELRMWCAASSSGEEPYTMAMIAEEEWGGQGKKRTLATDISIPILQKAAAARYGVDQVARLPAELREKYFVTTYDDEGEAWCSVVPEIREQVVFKRLNLAKFPIPLKGPIDVIFCRNVMIYFDLAVRQQLINEFVRLLNPGGYLILSHSENLLGITHPLVGRGTAVYQKGGEMK